MSDLSELRLLTELAQKLCETDLQFKAEIHKGKNLLRIDLNDSSLDFTISEKGKLKLVTERWFEHKYHDRSIQRTERGERTERTERSALEIGDPTIENLIKIINLFQEKGRGNENSNKSIRSLLSNKLTIDEFKSILDQKNYKIDSDELKLLINCLTDANGFNKSEILDKLKYQFDNIKTSYECSTYHENGQLILNIYNWYSGLRFFINKSNKLVLDQESWCESKIMWCDNDKIVIGRPTINNIMKTILLFYEKGRAGNSSGKSMMDLIQIEKSDFDN